MMDHSQRKWPLDKRDLLVVKFHRVQSPTAEFVADGVRAEYARTQHSDVFAARM